MKKHLISLPQNGLCNRLAHASTSKLFAEQMGWDFSLAWETLNLFVDSPYKVSAIRDLNPHETLFLFTHFSHGPGDSYPLTGDMNGDSIQLFLNYGCYDLSLEDAEKYFNNLGFKLSELEIDEGNKRVFTKNHSFTEIKEFFNAHSTIVLQGWGFSKSLYGPTGLNTHSIEELNREKKDFYGTLPLNNSLSQLTSPYIENFFKGKSVVGIQARFGDRTWLYNAAAEPEQLPDSLSPEDLQVWCDQVDRLGREYDHIFICSDSTWVCDYFSQRYPHCFSFRHSFQRDVGSTGCYWNDIEANDLINFHPPTNLTEQNTGNCKKTMCKEDFAAWNLLTQCNKILFSDGSSYGYEASVAGGVGDSREIPPNLTQNFPLKF